MSGWPEIQITIGERSLSDKSKVYSVIIRREDQTIEIECVTQKHAVYLHKEIGDSIDAHSIFCTREVETLNPALRPSLPPV